MSSAQVKPAAGGKEGIEPAEGDRLVAGSEPEARVAAKGEAPAKKAGGDQTFSVDEVAKHNTKEDCFVIIGAFRPGLIALLSGDER